MVRGQFKSASVAGTLSIEMSVMLGDQQVYFLRPSNILIFVNYRTNDVTGPWDAYTDGFELSECYTRGKIGEKNEGMHKF